MYRNGIAHLDRYNVAEEEDTDGVRSRDEAWRSECLGVIMLVQGCDKGTEPRLRLTVHYEITGLAPEF